MKESNLPISPLSNSYKTLGRRWTRNLRPVLRAILFSYYPVFTLTQSEGIQIFCHNNNRNMWTRLSRKTTQFSRFSETLTSSSKWLAVSAKLSLGPIIWLAKLNQRSYPYHVSTPIYMVDNLLSHSLLPTSIFYLTCNEIKKKKIVLLNETETLRESEPSTSCSSS